MEELTLKMHNSDAKVEELTHKMHNSDAKVEELTLKVYKASHTERTYVDIGLVSGVPPWSIVTVVGCDCC